MNTEDEKIKILMDLGLTFCQAKTYLALVLNGLCTAKAISQISNVTRQDVYRIMPMLEKRGLVQKVLGIPTEWKAIPIEEGVTFLLEQKNRVFSELKEKTTELINSFKENNKASGSEEKSTEFIIIAGGKVHSRWIGKKIRNAKENIDAFVASNVFKSIIFNGSTEFKNDLKRNVKFRHIVYSCDGTKKEIEFDPCLKENPNFQVRYMLNPPLAAIALFDRKEAVFTNPTEDFFINPRLWSNNPHFVALLQKYFDVTWEKTYTHTNEEQ